MKKKEIRTIVKINAPLAQANEWTRKSKELKISRSEYLLGIIGKNTESNLFERILKKLKKALT